MRYLLHIALGFLGACLLSAYLPETSLFLGAAGVFLSLGLLSLKNKRKKTFRSAMILLGAVLGFFWYFLYGLLVLKPLKPYDHQKLASSLVLTEDAREKGIGSAANGILTLDGRSYRTRIYFKKPEQLRSGDRVEGLFRIRLTKVGDPNSSLPGNGIFLAAYEEGNLERISGEKIPVFALPGRVRTWTQQRISRCFSPKAAPFARALLLGDTEDLSFRTRWDLRISGISHLVAVSGLHVSVLCLLLSAVTFHNKWLMAGLGFPLLAFFGAMTGFTPSVTRACLMMGFLLAGTLLERRYDPRTALGAAMICMLLINPLTVTSISFQLSCASVLGIFLGYGPLKFQITMGLPYGTGGLWETIRNRIAESCALSLSSLIFVTPLCALYFGSVSLIAVLTNLLTVWLVPILFHGILLTLFVSLFAVGPGLILGKLLSMLIICLLSVSHVLAEFPLAAVFTESVPITAGIFLVYGLGFFFLRGISREYIYFGRASVLVLLLSVLLAWTLPGSPNVTMKVYDVGQGQCILLNSRGRNFLVDCGGDRPDEVALQVLDTLCSRGIRRLDGLIFTHFDRDHVCAAESLLSVVDADRIYVPRGSPLPEDDRLRVVTGEWELSFGDTVLRLYGSEAEAVSNEMGLCVLLDSPEYDILITGDRSIQGERMLLHNHSIPPVDCLLAGHHGAGSSTGTELLTAACPHTVIISAGRKNRYGHPAGETLRRLKQYDCQVLRTDLDGTITIRR